MGVYNDINSSSKYLTNSLLNSSERNSTIVSTTPNFSTFDKSFQLGTTFDAGKAIPVLLQEVYPSDIYDIDINAQIRLSAQSSTPFMNINWDINYFFVPFEQIDREFKQLMGENNDYGYSNTQIEFPKLKFDNYFTYTENDLGNYFNIPLNKNFESDAIQIYPFLAYGKIWNEWYRDQNLQSSINISSVFNETRTLKSSTYKSDMSFYESVIYGKGLAPTSKFPNFFTTSLPYQQKGNPVKVANLSIQDIAKNLYIDSFGYEDPRHNPEKNVKLELNTTFGNNVSQPVVGRKDRLYIASHNSSGTAFGIWTGPEGNQTATPLSVNLDIISKDGSNYLTDYTINDLRYSIVAQHLMENWALCGSRYVEQLKSIWGIEIDPKNINRTELIGGYNETLIYNNVLQTSQTTTNSQLGRIATNLYNQVGSPRISYAASQHGYIIGILTLRTAINNGGQGLNKLWKYDNFLDLFNPLFNGIGEQPTKNQEIYYNDADRTKNDKTFGFNEPFLNTKYNIDNSNGYLSLNSNTSLFPVFLFGEKYNDTPVLGDKWIQYDPNIIGNTLYNVNDNNKEFYHQFIAFFTFSIQYTTKQPLFNSPRIYGI